MVTDIGPERSQLRKLVATLQYGDHLYHSYEKPYSQLPLLTSFLAVGLEQNQQCLHVSADSIEEAVMTELRTQGVDSTVARQRGALRFLGKWQWRGQEEPDPAVLFEGLTSLVAEGRRAGYTGTRLWADMSWTQHPGIDPLKLEALETMFHRVIQDEPVIAVCSYNCRRLPAATVKAGENTHPWCIGNNRLLPNERSRLAALLSKHAPLLRQLDLPSRPYLADA